MKKTITIYLVVVLFLLFGGYIFIALNQQQVEVELDPQVKVAIDYLEEEFGQNDSVVAEYVNFHQLSVPEYVYEELLGTDEPTKKQIFGLIVHIKTENNIMYFSLKDEVTDYLLIVSLDENKQPTKVEMQQDNN